MRQNENYSKNISAIWKEKLNSYKYIKYAKV